MDFVNELKKYIKITRVCDNSEITKCFNKEVIWNEGEAEDIYHLNMDPDKATLFDKCAGYTYCRSVWSNEEFNEGRSAMFRTFEQTYTTYIGRPRDLPISALCIGEPQ